MSGQRDNQFQGRHRDGGYSGRGRTQAPSHPPSHSPSPPQADNEQIILDLASRQHGVVTRAQLVAAGIAAHAIDYRLEKRRLKAVYRGVYRLGPVRSRYEEPMAAVLSCGAGALLSHATAVALWEFAPEGITWLHVTVEGYHRASSGNLRVHRVRELRDEERAVRHGIPLTSVARTLLDVAAGTDEHALERMIAMAERQRLASAEDVMRLIAQRPHHRGIAKLRRVVGDGQQAELTRSEAEARFLGLIRAAELKRPAANVEVRGWEVDFLWRAERLIVEIDGFRFHASADAFHRDRRRDAILLAAGLKVMRVTWRQLVETPHAVVARVAQALGHAEVL